VEAREEIFREEAGGDNDIYSEKTRTHANGVANSGSREKNTPRQERRSNLGGAKKKNPRLLGLVQKAPRVRGSLYD